MEKMLSSTVELLEKQNPYQKVSATDIVIHSIKTLLINDRIKVGDRLPNEMEIANSLNVSRGSVREAMKILSALGVVDIRRGDGTYIVDNVCYSMVERMMLEIVKKERNTSELAEIRELIERGIMHLCVDKATKGQIRAIRSCVDVQETLVADGLFSFEQIQSTELRFHEAMADGANNQTLKVMYMYIMELYLPAHCQEVDFEDHMRESLRVHKAILDAIENRNHVAGEVAIREAISQWKRLLGTKENCSEDE